MTSKEEQELRDLKLRCVGLVLENKPTHEITPEKVIDYAESLLYYVLLGPKDKEKAADVAAETPKEAKKPTKARKKSSDKPANK